jgi:outer membrane protein assembly factor BamB
MKTIFFFTCLLFINTGQAQPVELLHVTSGSDITIVSGTIFKTEGLTLTPSANFTLSNNTLNKDIILNHSSPNPFIRRVYQFTGNTNPFSGSVQIDYTDGAELNGIAESALTLNNHDGTSWTAYAPATRDGTNNFVLTNGLSSVVLNELTLADLATPLPLTWLSFTASKHNQTVLLQWVTPQEHNTRNFTIQQSTNGINWVNIGTLPAAGNSSVASKYSYVYNTPVTGINHYRIMQTDMDYRYSYSGITTFRFSLAGEPFFITANPVNNNILTVQVNTAAVLALYANDGKLLWQEPVNAGIKYIDVSKFAKGTYILKANATTQKVLIQ